MQCGNLSSPILRWQDYAELHLQNAKQVVIQLTGSDARQGQFQYDNRVGNQHYSYPVF